MEKYTINDTTLVAIADAIRAKSGTTGGIDPANMAALIAAIESGGGGYVGTFTLESSSKYVDIELGTRDEINAVIVVRMAKPIPSESINIVFLAQALRLNALITSYGTNAPTAYSPSSTQYPVGNTRTNYLQMLWFSQTSTRPRIYAGTTSTSGSVFEAGCTYMYWAGRV